MEVNRLYKYVLIIIMKHQLLVLFSLCFYFTFHIFRKEDLTIINYYNPIELKKRVNLDSNLKSDDIKVDTLKIGNMKYLSNITKNENVINDRLMNALKDLPLIYDDKLCIEDECVKEHDFKNLKEFWPRGVIIPYFNTLEKLPADWLLCDGKNGTPDLRNRFVIGAGRNYKFKSTGGEKTVTLDKNTIPNHSHKVFSHNPGFGCGSSVGMTAGFPSRDGWPNYESYVSNHNKDRKTEPHNNMPPYYSMFYIMRKNNIPPEKEVELVIKNAKEKTISSEKVKEEIYEVKLSNYQKLKKQLLDMNKVPYS